MPKLMIPDPDLLHPQASTFAGSWCERAWLNVTLLGGVIIVIATNAKEVFRLAEVTPS